MSCDTSDRSASTSRFTSVSHLQSREAGRHCNGRRYCCRRFRDRCDGACDGNFVFHEERCELKSYTGMFSVTV